MPMLARRNKNLLLPTAIPAITANDRQDGTIAVYCFPTRALLTQVSNSKLSGLRCLLHPEGTVRSDCGLPQQCS